MELKQSDISFRAAKMCFNRFCIDEDAAFELSGVYSWKTPTNSGKGFDEKVIDSIFKKIVENKKQDMETHFVYAVDYDYWFIYITHFIAVQLRSLIHKKMKKYKIKKVMVTCIEMWRRHLITRERMEHYCMGKEYRKVSANDDLQLFFENVLLGEEPDDFVCTYFLPMLTNEELKLVERKDHNFMKTFRDYNADVTKAEMMLSESSSKFVFGQSERLSFIIENEPEVSKFKTSNRCDLQ